MFWSCLNLLWFALQWWAGNLFFSWSNFNYSSIIFYWSVPRSCNLFFWKELGLGNILNTHFMGVGPIENVLERFEFQKNYEKCTFSALLRALLKALISYTKSKKTHHHCFSAHRKLFKRFLIKILCSTDWHGHGEYVTYP